MKFLFLTQYFPPEVGAPQNRLFELAVRIQKKGAEVTILTAMPNYPQMAVLEEYKNRFYVREKIDGLDIHRAYIFAKKSGSIIIRLLNYFSFVISSFIIGIIKIKKQDFLFCESPPLFLGISAFLLSKIKGAKLIFNVSDLWPESAEKLGLVNNKLLLKIAAILEEFLYKNSFLITGQTQGIVRNISSRFPDKNIHWLKNGVDIRIFNNITTNNWREKMGFSEEDFILLYAGILGYAQGLEVILNAANKLKDYENIKFVLVGDGPEKQKLVKLKNHLRLEHVIFLDPVPKKEIPNITSSIDAGLIPLKKLELFKGAIPSKIFEILASKKPILLGVEGEAKELFIEEGNAGLAFEPENFEELAEKILRLFNSRGDARKFGENGFAYVNENFNRDKIADNFWLKLI